MYNQGELERINAKIRLMQRLGKELADAGEDFPALQRNMVRIMASLKMLELDISDVMELAALHLPEPELLSSTCE